MEVMKIDSYIEELREALQGAGEKIKKAGDIVAKALDEDPANKERLIEAFPHIPYTTWATFERIGRGQIDHRLALNGGHNAKRIERLPTSDQKRIMDGEKIPLVIAGGDKVLIDPRTCTKEQADQLFDGGCLRSEGGQRAHLESLKNKVPHTRKVYRVIARGEGDGSELSISKACVLTKRELLKILEEM